MALPCTIWVEKMRDLKNRHVFVSFEQGARGHKFARVLATMPCVYWYSCEENGINPWNVGNPNSYSRQRGMSKYHFDRITPKGKLPPTFDYVKRYFKSEKDYYTNVFDPLFEQNGGADIIANDQRALYCTHSTPDRLLEYFPNSIIFNIIHNPVKNTERYMDIVKEFPGYVKHYGVVPSDNEYLRFLELLENKKQNGHITLADIWAYENKKKFWDDKYTNQLKRKVSNHMQSTHLYRSMINDERVLNVFDHTGWDKIKDWMNGRLQ